MSELSSTEDFLLASDNQLGDLWAHHYIDGAYPEAIEDWLGTRQFFYEAYVSYREKECLAEQRFRVPKALDPGSPAYVKSVQEALGAGQVVFDSEWRIEQTLVRVPVLAKTSDGIEATVVRSVRFIPGAEVSTTH
jgi:hypothetical protein